MANVPWHEEIVTFVQKFVSLLPDYEIASEHEHSNCILAANKKVSVMIEMLTLDLLALFGYYTSLIWVLYSVSLPLGSDVSSSSWQ